MALCTAEFSVSSTAGAAVPVLDALASAGALLSVLPNFGLPKPTIETKTPFLFFL